MGICFGLLRHGALIRKTAKTSVIINPKRQGLNLPGRLAIACEHEILSPANSASRQRPDPKPLRPHAGLRDCFIFYLVSPNCRQVDHEASNFKFNNDAGIFKLQYQFELHSNFNNNAPRQACAAPPPPRLPPPSPRAVALSAERLRKVDVPSRLSPLTQRPGAPLRRPTLHAGTLKRAKYYTTRRLHPREPWARHHPQSLL